VEHECLHLNFEYLLWYVKKQQVPPLVTSGPVTDNIPGSLGLPNTRTLLRGGEADENQHSGVRATLRYDLDADEDWAVDASFFALEQRTGRKAFRSTGDPGSPVLARPFFNVNLGVEDADPVAVPNVLSGTISVETPRRFFGADADLRWTYYASAAAMTRVVFLLGGRYLSLDEKLIVGENLQDLPGLGNPGNAYLLNENFTTYNRFYGGQAGAEIESHFGPAILKVVGKVALGTNEQVLANSAFTQIREPNGVVTTGPNRALLIQPSNAGRFTRHAFAAVPEWGVFLAWEFNRYVRLGAGYNFLYWTQVLRPGSAVDRAVNIQALQPFDQVGIARPAPLLDHTGFWAQGLTVNLEISF
jgi:hypothetical protein